MLIIYDILYIFFAICYFPVFLIRRKYHRGFLMRLGIFPQGIIDKLKSKKVIWLHAVSVGEAQASGTLIKSLKEIYPDCLLVVSTVTKTGNKIARNLTDKQDLVIYSPLDIGFVTRRVVNLISPKIFIIAETEIWPNLITAMAEKGIRSILVNGRISSASFRGYKIIRSFLRKVLESFSLFCMQTEKDARRLIALGADENRVKITGNMKFDILNAQNLNHNLDLSLCENEQLFIAGSTHRGEEEIILEAYKELSKDYAGLRLLIAPRHIERTQEIERLIEKFGFESQKISRLTFNKEASGRRQVLILDTIGQLKGLYALAELVFIGGSLIPHGGQNPIEAAVFYKPIIFGPYMFNFSAVTETLLKAQAAIMVKDSRELKDECMRILNDPALKKELGRRAKEAAQENTGATAKNTNLIKELIKMGVN